MNVARHSFPFNLENNQIKEGRSCQRNLGLVDHASSSNIEKSTSYILYLLCYAIIPFDSMFVIHVHSEINKRETFFERLDVDIIKGEIYIFDVMQTIRRLKEVNASEYFFIQRFTLRIHFLTIQ